MEILLGLGFKLLPYVLALLAAVGVYFGIKHKGVKEERARQAEQVKQVEQKLVVVAKDDASVDAKVREKLDEVTKPAEPVAPPVVGDIFKF